MVSKENQKVGNSIRNKSLSMNYNQLKGLKTLYFNKDENKVQIITPMKSFHTNILGKFPSNYNSSYSNLSNSTLRFNNIPSHLSIQIQEQNSDKFSNQLCIDNPTKMTTLRLIPTSQIMIQMESDQELEPSNYIPCQNQIREGNQFRSSILNNITGKITNNIPISHVNNLGNFTTKNLSCNNASKIQITQLDKIKEIEEEWNKIKENLKFKHLYASISRYHPQTVNINQTLDLDKDKDDPHYLPNSLHNSIINPKTFHSEDNHFKKNKLSINLNHRINQINLHHGLDSNETLLDVGNEADTINKIHHFKVGQNNLHSVKSL